MLGAHHPVPPRKIKAEIAIALAVMEIVMGRGRDPAERANCPAGREEFDPACPMTLRKIMFAISASKTRWMR